MPIDVGINENVVLTGITINDKGVMGISFDELANLKVAKTNIFDDLQTAKVANDGKTGRTVNLFPFKRPTGGRNDEKTEDELIQMVSDDMASRRSQLTQLMEIYVTTDDINKVWNPYVGTGIDKDNYRTQMLNDDALRKVFDNMSAQTVSILTPFFKDIKYLLRLKLVRQSKDKHFPDLPKHFLADNPYVELMEVPTAKVKFTKYELAQGLDSAAPVAKPDAAPASDLPAAETGNVFGKRS